MNGQIQASWFLLSSALFESATPAPLGQVPHNDATRVTPPHEDKQAQIPPERCSVTTHEMTLVGKAIHYTATASALLIDGQDNKPYGSVFYVAYTEDGVTDPRTRPVTFMYNGGPGSASLWVHMGSVAAMRVITESPEASAGAPYQLVPNEYSLLDRTDLIFVDAVVQPSHGLSAMRMRRTSPVPIRMWSRSTNSSHATSRFRITTNEHPASTTR